MKDRGPISPENALIAAEGICLSYDGGKPLLQDVSFRIGSGTLYCLMGANGCGKSTLINCILGIHAPDRGRILIGGREVDRYRPGSWRKKYPSCRRSTSGLFRTRWSRSCSWAETPTAALFPDPGKKTGGSWRKC